MRKTGMSIALLLILGGQFSAFGADEDRWWAVPVRFGESNPVTKNGASFQVVAETEWNIGKRGEGPVDIRLRITNVSKRPMIFQMDSVHMGIDVMMKDAAGKVIRARGGSNGPVVVRPILIPAGGSYSVIRKAEIQLDNETKTHELWYYNEPKGVQIFGPLSPGQYKLSFAYRVSSPEQRPESTSKTENAKEWFGDVQTNELTTKVLRR